MRHSAAAKSLRSCPTLCDPLDGSPPGSSIPGILQARTLEWVASSFTSAYTHAKLLQSCPPLRQQPTRLLCLWDSLGKNTGVGCQVLLHQSPSPTTRANINRVSLKMVNLNKHGNSFCLFFQLKYHFSQKILTTVQSSCSRISGNSDGLKINVQF